MAQFYRGSRTGAEAWVLLVATVTSNPRWHTCKMTGQGVGMESLLLPIGAKSLQDRDSTRTSALQEDRNRKT